MSGPIFDLDEILFITGLVGYIVFFLLDEGHLHHCKPLPRYHKLWVTGGVVSFLLILAAFFV